MENKASARRGRPRGFDRDAAVDTAMRLFWRSGFEGVSVGDLTDAIGVAPPSLYAAFGSKAGLYGEALDRYGARPGALTGLDAATSLRDAVEGLLRRAADAVTDPGGERGCMISNGLVQCAPEHAALQADLARRRERMRSEIAGVLARWLDPDAAARRARLLAAVMQGMAVQARDGADRAALQGIIDEVLATLPEASGTGGTEGNER